MNESQRETCIDWLIVDRLRLRCATWRGDGSRRGTIVICSGRSEFIEKYENVVGELLHRRFDVAAFDWRGQGLSDRLLPDSHKGYVNDQKDYLKDLETVLELVAEREFPKPLLMLGHSMGGQIGLRFLHDHPNTFQGAVLTAPAVRIRFGLLPYPLICSIVRLMCRNGRSTDYAFGQGPLPYIQGSFQGNVLTGSEEQFMAYRALLDADPNLIVGGATFGWLEAALRSSALFTNQTFAQQIACPILMVQGGLDRVVDNQASAHLARRLPQGELVCLEGARHEILIEQEQILKAFWTKFDEWVSRILVG